MKHTQKQLEAMSDFEINCILATINGSNKIDAHCNRDVIQSLKNAVMTDFGAKDYCNSWTDMGPLIDEIWHDLMTIVISKHGAKMCIWDDVIVGDDNKKLRAAAIVYILIKQGE